MKTIENLYDGLFETMQALQDGKMKPDQAMAVAQVAQTIINAAKVECEYAKINNRRGTNFVPVLATPKQVAVEPAVTPPSSPPPVKPKLTRADWEPQDILEGDYVLCPGGRYGTVKSVNGTLVDVEHDTGGVFPYNVKQVTPAIADRPKSPVVPAGPRVVRGRDMRG